MKLKLAPASQRTQRQLFDDAGPALIDFIDMKNPLVRLADSMQWELFEDHWRSLYSAAGGPIANARCFGLAYTTTSTIVEKPIFNIVRQWTPLQ